MFQRLKGAIDNRIAEEQARQRQAQLSAQPRPNARRKAQNAGATAGSASPARGATSTEKGPDPQDFEPEFVVGDSDSKASSVKDAGGEGGADANLNDEQQSSAGKESSQGTNAEPPDNPDASTKPDGSLPIAVDRPVELPSDVRVKLRKLERLETKYGELLKAYRTAHARVQAIEPFEAKLRENTPLASIGDPSALVEYLNQTKLKGDMVLDELRRVSADRDGYKKKHEQSEEEASKLKSEVKELQDKAKAANDARTAIADAPEEQVNNVDIEKATLPKAEDAKPESAAKSRIPSFALFSPKLGGSKEAANETSEDLFSYDSEVPRLEADLEERTAQVEQLNKEVGNLRTDLKVARESTEGMMQTLEERTKEVNTLRDNIASLELSKSDLQTRVNEFEISTKKAQNECNVLQEQLDDLKAQQTSNVGDEAKVKEAQQAWKVRESELETRISSLKADADLINEKLTQKDTTIEDLEDSLAAAKKEERDQGEQDKSTGEEMIVMNQIMDEIRGRLNSAQGTINGLKKELENQSTDFANRPSTKVFGLIGNDIDLPTTDLKTREDAVDYLSRALGFNGTSVAESQHNPLPATATGPADIDPEPSHGTGKKKNRKKKKGTKENKADHESKQAEGPIKVSETLTETHQDTDSGAGADELTKKLELEISRLKSELAERTAEVDKLTKQVKDEDVLREEIETLRDDLLVQGSEHVEARDALKKMQSERMELEVKVQNLVASLEEARKMTLANEVAESAHKNLVNQFDDLKSKFTVMETDLKAAEQLATARFKDISDLKELLSKAQPELRNLRSEVAELKSVKENLKNKQGELTRLESKHEDLKSEMKGLGKRLGDKDNDLKILQQKIEQESRARAKAEDELTTAQSDLRVAENKIIDANERAAQTAKDLAKAKEDATSVRGKLRDLEDQLSNHLREISSLKEDVSLKGALHASSQSLVSSLRDQTHELSTQAREASARTESLEEELAEAQRMLSERTREGQTMRTLLNQTESGTESRIREMRERMEVAVEERDRVEDEANVASRRMMREVEDAKNKVRDAQRQMKTFENERDELETKSRSWRRLRDELEQSAESAKLELSDVRAAMKGLREALDESERQIREAEVHKQDLRKQGEEASERIEKLIKANKSLSEEIKALQSGAARKGSLRPPAVGMDSGLQSSRTSMDSPIARSPAPPINRGLSRNTPTTAPAANPTPNVGGTGPEVGLSQAPVDYVYLKNVLLQFLERKDKAHQRQLIPVLGMLLHFDRDEEQKFVSAISAR